MSYPKFAVGEDVIVSNDDYLKEGDYEGVVTGRTHMTNRDVRSKKLHTGWFYVVEPDPTANIAEYWGEYSLRRRPADMGFKELIESLKKPITG